MNNVELNTERGAHEKKFHMTRQKTYQQGSLTFLPEP